VDLAARLEARGFVLSGPLPVLGLGLDAWRPPIWPDGLEVELVRDVAGYEEACRVVSDGYPVPWQGMQAVAERYGELVASGRELRCFVARADGRAVASATAFRDGATKVRPVRPATVARSLAIGAPADGALAAATATSIHVTPEDDIVDNIALLAETTGVFGETAPGVTLGALRAAVQNGEIGEDDRVVLLVTGDGLKTPGLVADRLDPIVVQPDADLILETLGGVA
jgi:hypothetical protein